MTAQPHNLIGLVEKLHQECVSVSLYKRLINQSLQELNGSCENLFRTLWINHSLDHSLSRLRNHERLSCTEWVESSNRASSVRFLEAASSLPTSLSAERYGHMLGTFRDSPLLLAEVVRWADSKAAMDVGWVVKDIFSVVYGQCVFQQDHELALQFVGGLVEMHTNSCEAAGSLFVDAEPALRSALSAYSALVPEFRLFLVASLRDPVMELLLYNEHLEYDITKAGKRFQSSTGDKPRFLFSEDLDASCHTLARVTNVLLDSISRSLSIFPTSMKRLISRVRSQAMARWPGTTVEQLRKPISNLLFGMMLGAPLVSPEVWGILPADVVIGDASRYNLCQVMGIIQACGWSHNQQVYKVIKHVDVALFRNIVDCIDDEQLNSGSSQSIFPVVSGLCRSTYLASLDQLQNLANLVVTMLESLRATSRTSDLCQQLESLNMEGIGQSSPILPYSSPTNSVSISDSSHSGGLAPKPSSALTLSTSNIKPSSSKEGKKKSSKKEKEKERRSQSAHSLNLISPQHANLTVHKSTSGGELSTLMCTGSSPSFLLPSEVLVLPFQRKAGENNSAPLWDFNLLSEEEFMSQMYISVPSQTTTTQVTTPPEQVTTPTTQVTTPTAQVTTPPEQVTTPTAQVTTPCVQVVTSSDQVTVVPDQISTPPDQVATQPDQVQVTIHCPPKVEEASGKFPEVPHHPTPSPYHPIPSKRHSLYCGVKDSAHSTHLVQDTSVSSSVAAQTVQTNSVVPSSDVQSVSEQSDVCLSIAVPSRLPPPIPPRRLRAGNPPRNIGSMIELPSPERVSNSLPSAPKRRSHTGFESALSSPSRSVEPRPQKNRDRVLSANTTGSNDLLSEVSDQSPKEFCQSLYCTQLSYKLRLALQSSHTLLAAGSLFSRDGGDMKPRALREELLVLLRSMQAHQGWMEEGLNGSLILEALRMVDPLPDALLVEAVSLVRDNAMKRASYVAYLVKLHQKFQTTNEQMKAVIDFTNQAKCIRDSVFLNFIVDKFLESEKERVNSFLLTLEDTSVSDEKVTIMEASVEAFSYRILQSSDLAGWSDTEAVLACLEDRLFTLAYRHVFHPNGGDSDLLRDQIFSDHLCKLATNLHPSQPNLQIPMDYHISCPWVSAQQQLRMLQLYKSPQGKLRCVVRCCQVLISLLQYAKCGTPPGADDLFPVLVYVLIKANPPNLLSTIQYIKNFMEAKINGEEAYWWTQFSAAVEFSKTM